jgi:hypothetical protein
MKKFVNVIRNNPALSLAFSALFMIVVAVKMIDSGRCLKTKEAPNGIISLELAWDKAKAKQIVNEWNAAYCNGSVISFKAQAEVNADSLIVNKAKTNIWIDYIFLIAYPLFFVVSILLLDPRNAYSTEVNPISQLMITFAIGSGFLDAIENIFMHQFIIGNTDLHLLFTLPATIKFLFVLVVIIFIIVYFIKSIVVRK